MSKLDTLVVFVNESKQVRYEVQDSLKNEIQQYPNEISNLDEIVFQMARKGWQLSTYFLGVRLTLVFYRSISGVRPEIETLQCLLVSADGGVLYRSYDKNVRSETGMYPKHSGFYELFSSMASYGWKVLLQWEEREEPLRGFNVLFQRVKE